MENLKLNLLLSEDLYRTFMTCCVLLPEGWIRHVEVFGDGAQEILIRLLPHESWKRFHANEARCQAVRKAA